MKRIFVDAGAFYAWLDEDDRGHARAVEFFAGAIASRTDLVTTNMVLAETHALVITRLRRPDIGLAVVESILGGWATVECATEKDMDSAAALLRRYADKAFSLCDAVSFVVMERRGIRAAASFDRHFRQYPGLDMVV
jgi:predicted nucleic acid-binding protein